MNGKGFVKSLIQSFFIVVTLIDVAMYVLGGMLQPEQSFGYGIFLYPLLYGFCSMIPVAVMYSGKELTVRQMLLRKAIQMASIVLIILVVIFGLSGLRAENLATILGISASVVIIYVLAEIISWFLDNRTAKKMTADLAAYQKRHQERVE